MRKSSLTLLFLVIPCMIHAVDLPWHTTMDGLAGEYPSVVPYPTSMELIPGADGLRAWGDQVTSGGHHDQITTNANYSSGGGGRGLRHWIGPGSEDMGGPIAIAYGNPYAFSTTIKEFHIRWYMRFDPTWQFASDGTGVKILYIFFGTGSNYFYMGNGGSAITYYAQVGDGFHVADYTINQLFNSTTRTSDGLWHCFELYVKAETTASAPYDGVVTLWIDGIQRLHATNVNHGLRNTYLSYIDIGHNSHPGDLTNTSDVYVDFDDIAMTSSTYIGPLNAGVAPVANFSGTPTSGATPLTVQFTDMSSNNPTSWAWDIDNDGDTDYTTQNPSHEYTTGTYSVKLTATNASGSGSETKTNYITVNSGVVAPVADFTASDTNGPATLYVQFTDTSTNNPTSWAWDVDGDSVTDYTTQNPSHNYDTPGTYTVTLTATNAAGSDGETKTAYITVLNEPAPPTLLFAEPFESFPLNSSDAWYNDTTPGTIVAGGQTGNCLQWSWASSSAYPTGCSAAYHAFPETDTVYISYYIKIGSTWRGSQYSTGIPSLPTVHPHIMHLISDLDYDNNPYLENGTSYNYGNLYIEYLADIGSPYTTRPTFAWQDSWRVNYTDCTPSTSCDITGVTENRSTGGCNGTTGDAGYPDCYNITGDYWSNYRYWWMSDKSTTKNQWVHVELYAKMNTISGSVGQANGILRMWQDNVLVFDKTNILYRTNQDATKKFKLLVLAPYIGTAGGSPIAQTIQLDSLEVWNEIPNGDETPTISGCVQSGGVAR